MESAKDRMKIYKYFLIALGIILIDQVSKLLVYKYMYLHEEVNVIGEWFRLHYLLNPGMAFGIRWQSEFGKLALTTFRIAAMFGIAFYLLRMARRGAHNGFLICMAMILGGAIGNVIDSTFYGVFLNNAPLDSPTRWFHGQVIDMLYFPLFHFYWPEWMPRVGGNYFEFFSPVFNIADSSIFLGVATILLYQRRFFREREEGMIEVVSQTSLQEQHLTISENGVNHTEQQIIIEQSQPIEKRDEAKPSDSLNSEQATL
jgi:signal peptidase II